ncbi:SRPBCC family protein [Salinithrix halophila]|uniref:Cell division protein n=1 Tax=Salinithrix halophila TaxID=1485204 RepID=A0ABV8JPW6_9BACL
MPIITLELYIKAPIQTCFDLSRNIDVHMKSTSHTHEKAVAGVTNGLIGLDESVTWEAIHFGLKQRLTAKITAFDPPHYFVDEMVEGPFKRIKHEHFFVGYKNQTKMIDKFDYTSPWGFLGSIADKLFLAKYMEGLLKKRNLYIKEIAEQSLNN